METDYDASLLPTTASRLIELALSDLESVEADSRYAVNMERWHEPMEDGICRVCLAGAVMARTLQIEPRERITMNDFWPVEDRTRLLALDSARTGAWPGLLRRMVKPVPVPQEALRLKLAPDYNESEALHMGDALRVSRSHDCDVLRKRLLTRLNKLGKAPVYSTHPEEFKGFMRAVAEILRQEGQ